jgi:hypothetical protein
MVFGLSNHDLIYNAQKLREFEAEYNRQCATSSTGAPKQQSTPNESTYITHSTQTPPERRESALLLQNTPRFILDRVFFCFHYLFHFSHWAFSFLSLMSFIFESLTREICFGWVFQVERSVQKMSKAILPPQVIEHQRQQLQQEYSAQKEIKYTKRRFVLDIETNKPFITSPTTTRRIGTNNNNSIKSQTKPKENDPFEKSNNSQQINSPTLSNGTNYSTDESIEHVTKLHTHNDNDNGEKYQENVDLSSTENISAVGNLFFYQTSR